MSWLLGSPDPEPKQLEAMGHSSLPFVLSPAQALCAPPVATLTTATCPKSQQPHVVDLRPEFNLVRFSVWKVISVFEREQLWQTSS